MQLIGTLGSPYVRRVAISLQLLGLAFQHRSLSVFTNFEEYREINPAVKSPTLICDDGEIIMDSILILQYAEAIAGQKKRLLPVEPKPLQRTLSLIGLALAACEKSVQIYYERTIRPEAMRYQPWLERISGQLLGAYDALEAKLAEQPLASKESDIDQAGITTAVAWQFSQQMIPDAVPEQRYPRLRSFSAEAERLPQFRAAPHGGASVCAWEPDRDDGVTPR